MLSWDDFRFVKAIAEARSLANAGAQLRINHSTVFRRLGQIEQHLGTRLFERGRAGYALTPCGAQIVPKSTVVKHSVYIRGQKTSISLEDVFWDALGEIASERNITRKELLEEVDQQRDGNLSSALRVFALHYYRTQAKRK
jgi:predicted DNA-binding ribbon-helix-helix protein